MVRACGAFVVAWLVAAISAAAAAGTANQQTVELVPLTPISMPSTEKYHMVLRDEEIRKQLNEKVKTPEEQAEYVQGYKNNEFNQWISDRMSLHRRSWDSREAQCLHVRYHPLEMMPTVSVVIIFHNEARSTLLRTVWSVLDRTPGQLLKEILLVDDESTMEHLWEPLAAEVADIPKTRLLRLSERSGLIRAKVHGARKAKGDVLVFLDSHCECNDGWLEPLLDRIVRNRRTVAMPIIDAIEYETWEHRTGLLERGVFDWSLTFKWKQLTEEDNTLQKRLHSYDPFASPAMAGGLFAIDREYFFESGSYDMGMETWGGENIEMSIRIWACGGRIEAVPCSHVAHVFRKQTPYKFKTDDPQLTIARNQNRVAEVWMDDHKDIYYAITKNRRHGTGGDISRRIAFRKENNCKSFRWYLKNVFHDLYLPHDLQVWHGGNFPSLSCPVDRWPWWKRVTRRGP